MISRWLQIFTEMLFLLIFKILRLIFNWAAAVFLDVVLLCAKQNVPLCGHKDAEEALNRGDSSKLLKFAAKFANPS